MDWHVYKNLQNITRVHAISYTYNNHIIVPMKWQ